MRVGFVLKTSGSSAGQVRVRSPGKVRVGFAPKHGSSRDVLTQGCRGQGQSGAPEADSRSMSKADHGGTHSSVLDTASSGDWSGRGWLPHPGEA